MATSNRLNAREIKALRDADERSGGWALFNRKTTDRLAAERGYFETASHPSYGQQWRITDAGRSAIREGK